MCRLCPCLYTRTVSEELALQRGAEGSPEKQRGMEMMNQREMRLKKAEQGDGAAAAGVRQQHIEHAEDAQRDAGEVGRAAPGDAGPPVVGAVDEAPHPHRGEAGRQRQQQIHHQHRRQQRATRCRRQEACSSQC